MFRILRPKCDVMKKNHFLLKPLTLGICATIMMLSCEKDGENVKPQDAIVISATGDITQKVNEFRQLVGEPLNTSVGQSSGRREINWDGVPDQFSSTSLPQSFFNPTEAAAPEALKRGFVYGSTGDFRISNNSFSDLEPSNANQFQSFSGAKVFANESAVLWDTKFELAGQSTPASVKAFGVVFSDVDLANNSFLEFFDGDKSLGKYFATPHDDKTSFSFLGVYFKNEKVTRVSIGHGNGLLKPGEKDITNGGTSDLVVLDDFIYSEPAQ